MKPIKNKFQIESIDYDEDGMQIAFCDGTFISYGYSFCDRDKPTIEIIIDNKKTTLVVSDDAYGYGFDTYHEAGVCLIAKDSKIIYNPEAFQECESLSTTELSYTVLDIDDDE